MIDQEGSLALTAIKKIMSNIYTVNSIKSIFKRTSERRICIRHRGILSRWNNEYK